MSAECKCSFRTRMLGDGCAVCNPDYLVDVLDEDPEDNESNDEPIPYTLTEAGRKHLAGEK